MFTVTSHVVADTSTVTCFLSSGEVRYTYQFRYLQKDYDDVCTLINVLNTVMNAFNERIIVPYLQEPIWSAFKETFE